MATPFDTAVLAIPGLVGYWPLNEPSGTTATDLVAANNGTIGNNPTKSVSLGFACADDVGMQFTASSSQGIDAIANSSAYQFGLGNYSVGCWFYMTADPAADAFVINRGVAGSGGNGFELYLGGGGGQYATSRQGTITGQTAVPSAWTNGGGTSHFIVMTHNRTGLCRSFIDGVPSGPGQLITSEASRSVSENATTYIARRSSGNYFNGVLAKVMLLSVALDDGIIKRLYNIARGDAGIVKIYNFPRLSA